MLSSNTVILALKCNVISVTRTRNHEDIWNIIVKVRFLNTQAITDICASDTCTCTCIALKIVVHKMYLIFQYTYMYMSQTTLMVFVLHTFTLNNPKFTFL